MCILYIYRGVARGTCHARARDVLLGGGSKNVIEDVLLAVHLCVCVRARRIAGMFV
jgi:hypothetical protein